MAPGKGEKSLRDWLERSGNVIGIVFIDIIRSTELLNQKKTTNHSLIMRAHWSRGSLTATRLNGRFVIGGGDDCVAAFRSATAAYQFACALLDDPGHPQIRVRAGVHFGTGQAFEESIKRNERIREKERIVGRDIIFCERVMEHGNDHELWVSDAAKIVLERESVSLSAAVAWITSEECELQGFQDRHRLWRAA